MLMEHHPLSGMPISIGGGGALSIRLANDCARFSLRIAENDTALASRAFGCELPKTIGATAKARERQALCLGPDEWQLYAPLAERDAIEAAFAALYSDCPHSLVDVGHRELGIAVEGAAAVLALRSACAFDLDAMLVEAACRTIFDKAQIILIREAPDRFRIEVWRSFTDHVWGLLRAASREIALGI